MSVHLFFFNFRLSYINKGEAIHHYSMLGSKVSIFACELPSLLYNFVVNIFAVTINFFISLLFPVICSYLNPWSPSFVPPILNSIPLQQKRRVGDQCVVRESFGGGIDWGSTSLHSLTTAPNCINCIGSCVTNKTWRLYYSVNNFFS